MPAIFPLLDRFFRGNDKRNVIRFAQKIQEKKELPPQGELTSYTGSSLTSAYYKYIQNYNPDKITLETYGKMRMDGQLNAGLQFSKLPIQSLNFSVECEDKDTADAVEKELKRHYKTLIGKMLQALDFGYSPLEKVWEERDGLWVYKKFKDPEVSTININTDDKGNFAGFTQTLKNIHLEPEKAFVFVHRFEHGNFYGIPRTKPAYPFWYAGELMMLYCNRYMERKGDPPLKFRYSRGNDIPTNHPNLDRALKLGQELRSNSTIVLPNVRDEKGEYAWNVEYLLDDKRAEQFLSYIKYLDVMKLRSVIVPERAFTQDTSTGSYAMAEAHADLFLLAEEGLISDCEDAINRYIIPPFVKYNFGMSAPPAIIDIAPITKENRQMLKEMVIEVMKAMAQNNEYFYFDIEKIAQELNVPIREIKKKEETEAEEKREYIKLELEKGRFWREPTEFEKKIDLAGIDKFLDDVQEKFQKDTGGLFDEMRDSAVRYLLPILEHKDIKGINDFTLKYKSQYTDIFKKYLRQCFDEGIQSVVKEFKAKVRDESIPQKQTQWLLGRAVSLSTKHTNEIQYKIVITCLSGIDAEKTVKTILFELNEIFEAYKGNEIANAISTETVTVLNRGRSLVADALKGWRRKV